jgi:hypothetical protein
MGNDIQVRIGEDPWVSSGEGCKIPEELVNILHDNGIYSLKDTTYGDLDIAGKSECKLTEF